MSRHKNIRGLNLDDELNDYDGDDGYYDEEPAEQQMSPADKARMANALRQTKNIIGEVPSLTDQKIEETLWYYYFDVERTVGYLLSESCSCYSNVYELGLDVCYARGL